MKRQLFSFITTTAVVLASAFSSIASAADAYDVIADCSNSHYTVPNKCSLTVHLGENYASKTLLKKVTFKVNGTPVHIAYNDRTPLLIGNSFSGLSFINSIPVTCGQTYSVSAHVITATSPVETKVGDPQPVICPAKANF